MGKLIHVASRKFQWIFHPVWCKNLKVLSFILFLRAYNAKTTIFYFYAHKKGEIDFFLVEKITFKAHKSYPRIEWRNMF